MEGNKKKYYLGLDIGTDSVGYAVTDEQYNLLKFHGNDAWGSMIFDTASLSSERREFRSARRRLDRRQQRVKFLQEIFAAEIAKVDPRFYIRLQESYVWREDTQDEYIFFNDLNYTDKEYYREYPTIHHLICELMSSQEVHDIRLIYLACAWLVAHRGHFLSNIDENNLDNIKDITSVYNDFESYFRDNEFDVPWERPDLERFGEILQKKIGVRARQTELIRILLHGEKASKVGRDELPFSQEAILKLLAGGTVKVKDLFCKDEYDDFGSISLGMDEEKFGQLMGDIGDDYDLIAVMRALYDWAVLADALAGADTISEAKVHIYEQHKKDLWILKYFVRKYCVQRYDEIFRDTDNKTGYVAYAYHSDRILGKSVKKAGAEDFSKYILSIVGKITVDDSGEIVFEGQTEAQLYADMTSRLEQRTFLPKQKNTDNRVIPYQVYLYELNKILDNASGYLTFLNDVDEDGVTNKDKVIAIFKFKLPYFVGPLSKKSEYAWVDRAAGRILPWNYERMIDFDKSEQLFIKKLTNACTYLPDEPVAPKDSLCYQRYMVLNEINNLRVNGIKIPVEIKQGIYHDLFEQRKNVRKKDIVNYLICNGCISKHEEESVSGIDIKINSSLSTYLSFRRLLNSGILSENDVENIVKRASYAEDKTRLAKWLDKHYPSLSEEDRRYICKIKIKDFGRLSIKFLKEFEGISKATGETTTILRELWETNYNLMEILSEEKYTFKNNIEDMVKEYYSTHPQTLEKRLDSMYVSNTVRRSIYRTLDIVGDVYKAFGSPAKIFVEMTRGGDASLKGKRTSTRREQIMEIYSKCRDEDVRDPKHQMESLGEYVDNKLQSDRVFLYFMQCGRSAYSGKSIDLERLMAGSTEYNIEHIYPQAYVKDDSIINNKVLVFSTENGTKEDIYPIKAEIRHAMHELWKHWHHYGNISDEKYKRLTRSTPFTDDERYGFINRQLTETSQSSKAVKELLKEKFPDAEVVCNKAINVSEFRQKFDIPKSRTYNDLHHAIDAYLNIVTGNVYHMRFSRKWFSVKSQYSVKTKTLYTHQVKCGDEMVWDGDPMLQKVIRIARDKNTAHFTKFAFYRNGKLFDQNLLKKAKGLTPRKKGLPTEKYGGYDNAAVMGFIPVHYNAGKKKELIILPIELMYGKRFLADNDFAKKYVIDRLTRILSRTIDDVSFPFGAHPWKINTILSLDGFRTCVTAAGGKGRCLTVQSLIQFSSDSYWKFYLKKLDRFTDKVKDNKNYIYDKEFDVVCEKKNVELYDLYIGKLQNSVYSKRVNAPLATLLSGRDSFLNLDVREQCRTLLNIHQVFGRMTGGCDLTAIGGSKNAAATNSFSTTVSNWKKNYSDVRVIDTSASGLWEKKSPNILDFV